MQQVLLELLESLPHHQQVTLKSSSILTGAKVRSTPHRQSSQPRNSSSNSLNSSSSSFILKALNSLTRSVVHVPDAQRLEQRLIGLSQKFIILYNDPERAELLLQYVMGYLENPPRIRAAKCPSSRLSCLAFLLELVNEGSSVGGGDVESSAGFVGRLERQPDLGVLLSGGKDERQREFEANLRNELLEELRIEREQEQQATADYNEEIEDEIEDEIEQDIEQGIEREFDENVNGKVEEPSERNDEVYNRENNKVQFYDWKDSKSDNSSLNRYWLLPKVHLGSDASNNQSVKKKFYLEAKDADRTLLLLSDLNDPGLILSPPFVESGRTHALCHALSELELYREVLLMWSGSASFVFPFVNSGVDNAESYGVRAHVSTLMLRDETLARLLDDFCDFGNLISRFKRSLLDNSGHGSDRFSFDDLLNLFYHQYKNNLKDEFDRLLVELEGHAINFNGQDRDFYVSLLALLNVLEDWKDRFGECFSLKNPIDLLNSHLFEGNNGDISIYIQLANFALESPILSTNDSSADGVLSQLSRINFFKGPGIIPLFDRYLNLVQELKFLDPKKVGVDVTLSEESFCRDDPWTAQEELRRVMKHLISKLELTLDSRLSSRLGDSGERIGFLSTLQLFIFPSARFPERGSLLLTLDTLYRSVFEAWLRDPNDLEALAFTWNKRLDSEYPEFNPQPRWKVALECEVVVESPLKNDSLFGNGRLTLEFRGASGGRDQSLIDRIMSEDLKTSLSRTFFHLLWLRFTTWKYEHFRGQHKSNSNSKPKTSKSTSKASLYKWNVYQLLKQYQIYLSTSAAPQFKSGDPIKMKISLSQQSNCISQWQNEFELACLLVNPESRRLFWDRCMYSHFNRLFNGGDDVGEGLLESLQQDLEFVKRLVIPTLPERLVPHFTDFIMPTLNK